MNQRLALIAAMAACSLATTASASEWWFVAESKTDDVFFIDVSSMQFSSQKITYWYFSIARTVSSEGVKSEKTRVIVSCSAMKSDTIQNVTYKLDGSILRSHTFLPSPTPSGVVPDSVGETMAKFVCALPPMREKLGVKIAVTPETFARSYYQGETPPQ